jgi:arylsulfatase
VSFRHTFDDPGAPSRRTTQYYEMFGCRALYHRGWKAVTYRPMMDPRPHEEDRWELYDVEADPSECTDLAAARPEKLRELVDRWWTEAEKHQVLPLDDRPFSELVFERPPSVAPRTRYVYWPEAAAVPEAVAVNVRNRSHTVRAEVEVPAAGAEGVLVAQGSLLGGWTLYVKDGRLRYAHNFVGLEEHRIRADVPLAPGARVLELRFTRTAEHRGDVALLVDGTVVARGEVPRFTTTRFSLTGAGLTCGRGNGLAVTDDYRGPFPFTGRIRRVVVEVEGGPFRDAEGEAEVAIATQ